MLLPCINQKLKLLNMKNKVLKLETTNNDFKYKTTIDTTSEFMDFSIVMTYKNEAPKIIDIQIEEESDVISINGITLLAMEANLLIDFLKLYNP